MKKEEEMHLFHLFIFQMQTITLLLVIVVVSVLSIFLPPPLIIYFIQDHVHSRHLFYFISINLFSLYPIITHYIYHTTFFFKYISVDIVCIYFQIIV